jgi:hypothetical protein
MMENMALATQMLARELGVGVGQLRTLGEQGKITGNVLARALIGNSEQVLEMFDKLPPTIDMVHARLVNAFEVLFNTIDKRWELSTFYKDLVQGALVDKINALSRAISEGGRPSLRDEELRGIGRGTQAETPVPDRAEQIRRFLVGGQIAPTEEEAARIAREMQDGSARLDSLIQSIERGFGSAATSVMNFLGFVTHRVGEFRSWNDRVAAMRLENEFASVGTRLSARVNAALMLGEPSTKQNVLPELRGILRDAAGELAEWPHAELTDPHIDRIREVVEQQAAFLANTQRDLAPALEELAKSLEGMPLTRLLVSTGQPIPDFRQRLSLILERAKGSDLPLRGHEFAGLVESTVESFLHEMKGPLDAMREQIRDVEPWKAWVGTTKDEWAAAINQVGTDDMLEGTMRSLVEMFVRDTIRRFVEARSEASRAINEQVQGSIREAITGHASEIARSGLPTYLSDEASVRLGVDLGREPGRQMAVLDAQRQRYAEIQHILNAINVTSSKVIAQAETAVRKLGGDANRVLDILDELDVQLDELRSARTKAGMLPEGMIQENALARLDEAEARARKSAETRVRAIRDKSGEQLINEIENITHAAQAASRRLLSDEEKIRDIERDREETLKRLLEIEKELAVSVEPQKSKAMQALAAAREAVARSAGLKTEDIRSDAAKKSLDEIARVKRAMEEAENRFLSLEDKQARVHAEIDADLKRLAAARADAVAARPADKSVIDREYEQAVQTAELSRLRRLEGLRMDEAAPALRAIERMRDLEESSLLVTTKEREEKEILEDIDRRRVAALRELAKLQAEIAGRSGSLTFAQQIESQELAVSTRRAIEARAERERVAEQRRLEREALENLKRIVQVGESAESSAAGRLPTEEKIAFYQNEQKEALEQIDRLYRETVAKAALLGEEERKRLETEAQKNADTAKSQVNKAAADRESSERARVLADIEKDIARIRMATMQSQNKALGVEHQIESVDLQIKDTLDQILAIRRQLVVLGAQDQERLAQALETLEKMVVASRDVRVVDIQETFSTSLAKRLAEIEGVGRSYERSVTTGKTGADMLRDARERYDAALADIKAKEDALARDRESMSPIQEGDVAGTLESERRRLFEFYQLDLAQIRERVEKDIRDANARALSSLAQSESRVVPTTRRLAIVDEETNRDLERYIDLRKKLSAFDQSDPEQASARARMEALIDEAQRARVQEGEYRKRKILEEASKAAKRASDPNEEVLRDLDDLLRTVGDERERFIARFTDRLTKAATPEQVEIVKKKAGEAFDREKLDELTSEDIPRLMTDTRKEELELARDKRELTREQYEIELAMLDLRERRIPLDARETAIYLQRVRENAARLEAVEKERKTMDLAEGWADTIVDGLAEITTQADDAADALRGMAKELANLTIRHAVLDPAAKSLGIALSSGFMAIRSYFGFADGGIMSSRGPVPIPAGRLASPMVAVFGEGAMAEAAVPLPDGRNIPVDLRMSGGAGGSSVTNVAIDARASIDPAMVAANAHRAAAQLIGYMQRRGGLR